SRRRHTRSKRDWSSDVCSSDLGIKILSTFNMYLAGAFAVFVLLIGPGVFIMNYFTESLGFLFSNYVDTFLYTNSLDMKGETHIRSEERRVGKECRFDRAWCQ